MTTLNLTVGAGADDGQWYTTGFRSDWGPTLGHQGFANEEHWARFTNVTIAAGSTVNTASMQFKSISGYTSTTVNETFWAFDEDNATAPTSRADALGRSRTGTVAWDAVGSWAANTWYTTPDITSVIATVVARAGWASGNALVTAFSDNASSAFAYRGGYGYESGSDKAEKLDITYTAGGGAVTPSNRRSLLGVGS